MISKLLNSQSKTVTGAAVVIAAATLLSRLVGIARDRIFAHYFGAGPVMDAYYAAFKIPDLIYNLLIVGALTAGFIPTFTKLFYTSDDKRWAWRLCNNVITIIGVALAAVCVIGAIFAPTVSLLIAPGFTGQSRDLVVTFTRIMFLSPFFLGISMVVGGILQSLRQFVLYSVAPIFYNIGIIFGATVLVHTPLRLAGLAAGVVFGAMIHAGIQIYGAYQNGYRWQWHFDLHDADTRLIGRLMVPRTVGLAVTQVNTVVVTVLASLLPVGSVAVYNYANNLQGVATGLVGIPFALAVFPVLSAMVAENNGARFIENLSRTVRQILFLIIPCSIGILLLRAQIVRVILGSGAFDWTATIATANALAFFALGLWAQSLIPLFARAFYALSDTKTPFVLGVIAELMSIIAALLLMKPLGVAGLALAGSIGATLNCVFLAVALRASTQNMEESKLLGLCYRLTAAGLAMAVAIQAIKYPLAKIFNEHHSIGILSQGLASGILGLLVYGLVCRLLRVQEMVDLQQSLKRRWLKLWNVPAGIDEAGGL